MADDRLRYRLLSGPDNHEFCERVSNALDEGYQLYGSPSVTYDPDSGSAIVVQAIVLPG